jgi:hypothetical protein
VIALFIMLDKLSVICRFLTTQLIILSDSLLKERPRPIFQYNTLQTTTLTKLSAYSAKVFKS